MESTYKRPCILRLTGITMADYVPVEDIADNRLLHPGTDDGKVGAEESESVPEAALPLDKIPRVFTSLDEWPHSTNLLCWSCGFSFDDRPKFEPTFVRESEAGEIEFGVRGNMCTFNCVETWIEIRYGAHANNEKRRKAQDNLCLVYFMFTGRRVSQIKPAPYRTELRKYGGELDEDTFWTRLRALDPVAGLRDHTPGSVVPERERAGQVRASLRPGGELRGGAPGAGTRDTPAGRASVWNVCRNASRQPATPVLAPHAVVDSIEVAPLPQGDSSSQREPLGPDAQHLVESAERAESAESKGSLDALLGLTESS
jgi:hypothetical protein